MSKSFYSPLLILLFFPLSLFSQVNVSGKIQNQNGKPIEFLEVQLKSSDSIIVKSELTNSDGEFSIFSEKGAYLLLIKQLGSVLKSQKITVNQDLNLGLIEVTESKQMLKEVVISKKLIERKVDRLVFNVENSVSATGGDAIDALKLTPRLRVSESDISMIGKSSMMVMIDDRLIQLSGEDLMNFLKTIQSDNIKSIEVISSPPAKYDASGNSGIINIKLKKMKKDDLFNSSITSTYEQKTYPTGSLGGNLSMQIKKLSIYSNISYKDGSSKSTENITYHYPLQTWDEQNVRREFNKILTGKIGLDYKQNDKTEYGIQYLGSSNKPSNNEYDYTKIYDAQNTLTNYYTQTRAKKVRDNYFHFINTHYKRTLDTLGKSITANFDYFITGQQTNRIFDYTSFVNNNSSFVNAFNDGNQKIKITTANVDLELPYSKITYKLGGKVSFINTDNDFNFYNIVNNQNVLDPNQSNKFNYTENTQSVYFSTEQKIKKWEYEIGLRVENTQTKGYSKNLNQTNTYNYIKFFPTFYLAYNANDKNTFSLDYSRRIGRPSYYMTNPFRTYINDYSYVEGNPFIQPEFNNNIELSHTYNNNLNTSFSFGYLENGKSQIQIIDPSTNVTKTTYLNFFKAYSYSLDVNYTLKINKWLESNNSATISYRKTKANELLNNQVVEQLGSYFSSNNTFILNKSKTFFSSLEVSYSSPQTVNVFKIGEVFNTNAGFRYLVLNKNLQFSLNFYDLFKTNKSRFSNYSNNVLSKSSNYYDNQSFRFSVLYKFGNNKINVKERKRGNQSETNRANQ